MSRHKRHDREQSPAQSAAAAPRTERPVEAEEALRLSDARLRVLTAGVPEVAFHLLRVAGEDLWVEFASDGVWALFEISPPESAIDWRRLFEMVHADDRERVRAAARTACLGGEACSIEYRIVTPAGKTKWLRSVVRPQAIEGNTRVWNGITTDISEHKRLDEQLLQAQKLESLGRLAGGIAHDFNNLTQAILGFSGFLAEALGSDDPRRSDVEEIRAAALKAAKLTSQLLAFSRKQMVQARPVDLSGIVTGAVAMLRRLLGEDVELVTNLAPRVGSVRADQAQIEQAIVSLAINAREAMPTGGRLTVSTAAVVLAEQDLAAVDGTAPGHFACLAVSDTGTGMTREVLEHVFEPFFTTKRLRSGLGLAGVYGTVKQHGGWIHVYSQVGQGTTFRIYLPVVKAAEAEPAGVPGLRDTAHIVGVRPGTRILLVEDEATVRNVVMRTLKQVGCEVHTAGSAAEARAIFDRETARFDLLLSDVVLPDGNGAELAIGLQSLDAELRVILASGYTDHETRWPVIRQRGFGFLQKPFPAAELVRTVRKALGARSV